MNAPSFQDLPASAYRGRFAPSPTGLLHAGSLTTAVGSYLHARSQGGQWLLRIEDLDPPREMPGAADAILRTLEALGFTWDGPVIWQSQRLTAYQDALDALIASGHAYPCACTRREIALAGHPGVDGVVYPGTCRNGLAAGKTGRAWRLHVPAGEVMFMDGHYGAQRQDVAHQVGDYVLKRADGLFAYQLAVVIDDAEQGVTHVVRGEDLADNTPRQILLQRALGVPTPRYLHTPLVLAADGQKLSKQNGAQALDLTDPTAALTQAASTLDLPLPSDGATLADMLAEWTAEWAARWRS